MTDNYPFSDYPFMGTFHCLYCPLRFQQLTELVAHYEGVHVPRLLKGPGEIPEPPVDGEPIGATTSDALMLDVPEAINKVGEPRPHRQRIGEKPQGINDVWEVTPGETVVSVHTDLMYTREDLCEWCKKGVPFATKKRTSHYVITKTGFEYHPCKGVKEGVA